VFRAELIKAWTTRTAFGLLIGTAVAAALGTASMVLSQPAEQLSRSVHEQQFYFINSILVAAFAVVLGVRSFTDEFRYGSIVPTFSLSPRRPKVLVAKLLASAILGAILAVVAQAVMVGVAMLLSGAKGARPAIAGADLRAMVGLVVAAALWAAIGAAVGAAGRHQIAAIVGAIVWVLVVENVAGSVIGDAARFLPGRAGHAVADASAAGDLLSTGAGGVLLATYMAAAAVVGLLLLHRDVEAA
jgi:ABC-type transport system involved in multi-copper enzyme maturation permease subunit